jgi:hypothetical protein
MRPLVVFGSIAATMVLWLSTRMWLGDQLWVWKASCLLGVWAPIGAAAVFLYVRETAHREDGVFAAWCVRAIGMHWVLVWLVGMSDWLRGPPHTVPQWNSDAGMPLVFLAFFPVFALSVAALQWTRSVAARVAAFTHARQSGSLQLVEGASSPYRGAATELRREVPRAAPPSFAPVLAGAVGLGAMWAALSTSLSSGTVLVGTAVALSLASLRSARALAPSVFALFAVGGLLVTRAQHLDSLGLAHRAALWPVTALTGLALYLGIMEGRLRLARLSAR